MIKYILCIAAVLVIMPVMYYVLVLVDNTLGIRACRWFSWHLPPKIIGYDGASLTGTCPRCGKAIMLDSQGNWF